jgi:ribose transport system permease protein
MREVAQVDASSARHARVNWLNYLERYALLLVWGVLVAVFGVIEPSTFLTSENFASMFSSQSVLVVLTLGLIIPLTSGDYDLSIAFNLTFASMVVAILNAQHHWSVWLASFVALCAGLVIGAANAIVIVGVGIDSFIVTLGSGTVVGGLTLLISGSNTVSGLSHSLEDLVVIPKLWGLGLEFFYALGLTALVWYMLEYTSLGQELLFTGRSRTVSRLAGVNVARLRAGALVASGALGALAGVLNVGTTGAADPTSGTNLLLPAFAAAFLGSTTIVPGKFNAWGSLCATYFLVTGITGLSLLGIQVYVQDLFYGGALVIAVALGHIARTRRARGSREE